MVKFQFLVFGALILFSMLGCSPMKFGEIKGSICGANSEFCQSEMGPQSTQREPSTITKLLSYGLVTKNTSCVVCHTRIHGDISGFGTMTFRADSMGTVRGNIYAADLKLLKYNFDDDGVIHPDLPNDDGRTDPNLVFSVLPEIADQNLIMDAFGLPVKESGNYVLRPNEPHNQLLAYFAGYQITFDGGGDLYSLTMKDSSKRQVALANLALTPNGRPIARSADFPTVDANSIACRSKATGTLRTGNNQVISNAGIVSGNTVLINGRKIDPLVDTGIYNEYDTTCSPQNTLTIMGQVIIDGDLVLAGCITGSGTIYSTGNIFVPNDIKLKNSPFPFLEDSLNEPALALEVQSKLNLDMVSLAASKFIIIGKHRDTLMSDPEGGLGAAYGESKSIYNWLAGTNVNTNMAIYEQRYLKKAFWTLADFTMPAGREWAAYTPTSGAVALIEANLYANLGVAYGLTYEVRSNYKINGSILTPNLVLVGGGPSYATDTTKINPFSNIPLGRNEINQDFRLKYSNFAYECLKSN